MLETKPDSILFETPRSRDYKFDDVNIEDPRVWSLYCKGDVKGLFQVESNLCKDWCKVIKPKNIDELSALISLVRPGGLNSGFCDKYAKIKNGLEEPSYIHDALKSILEKTHSCLVFQESILRICVDIAGFTEVQADDARRAVGKKLPEEMDKVRKMFMEGAKNKGIVDEKTAEEIFGWIQKSVRYLFNACVTDDTVVQTEAGLKTISELVVGEKVLAPNNEWTRIVNKYDNGIKEVYEIELSSGLKIKSTMDHEYLCSDMVKRKLIDIINEDHEIVCQ